MSATKELNNEAVKQLIQGRTSDAIQTLFQALGHIHEAPAAAEDQFTLYSSNSFIQEKLYHYDQPLKYDEGMDTFGQPISLENSKLCTNLLTKTTIFFNLGLAYSRSNGNISEDGQEHFFLQAIDSLPSKKSERFIILSAELSLLHIASLHNIGRIYFQAGKYGLAIDAYSTALDGLIKRSKFLVNHSSLKEEVPIQKKATRDNLWQIAATLNCIAVVRCHLQDEFVYPTAETIAILENAISIHHREELYELGRQTFPHLRALATIINNIGRAKSASGDHNSALSAYKEAYYLRATILPLPRLDIAAIFFNIAEAHQHLGNTTQAIDAYSQFHAIASEILGDSHDDVVNVLVILGHLTQDDDNMELAKDFLNRARKSSINGNSPNKHAQCATIDNELGRLAFQAGDLKEALIFFKSTGLNLEHSMFEDPNREEIISITMVNMAHVLNALGRTAEAVTFYSEALTSVIARDGTCEQAAKILTCIAYVHEREQEYDLAENCLKEAITIHTNVSGRDSASISLSLNILGTIYSKQGKFDKALDSFLESMQMRLSSPHASDSDKSIILFNVACTYRHLDEKEKSIHYFSLALACDGRVMDGDENVMHKPSSVVRSVVNTMTQIASLYLEMDLFEEAQKYYQDSLQFYIEHRDLLDNVHCIDIFEGIRECYHCMILKDVNNSCYTNGRYNLAPAA